MKRTASLRLKFSALSAVIAAFSLPLVPEAAAQSKKSAREQADDCPPGMGCGKPVKLGKNGLPEGMADGKPAKLGKNGLPEGMADGKPQRRLSPSEMQAQGMSTPKERPQPGLRTEGGARGKP